MTTLVDGVWCQERKFGWLSGSPTACTQLGHHHIESRRNPGQPGHSVTGDWQRETGPPIEWSWCDQRNPWDLGEKRP